jgi:hypothetical protein
MKTTHLKYIAYALAALMLMQSCVVYHKTPVSVDEAVATNKPVKIYTTENKIYKFKKLVREEDNIYGISSLKGLNKKIFAQYVKEIDQEKELIKILLPFEIKEIYERNRTMSTVYTILIMTSPVWIFFAMWGLYAADL